MNIENLTEAEKAYRRIALQWFQHAHPEFPAWKTAKMVDEQVEEHLKKIGKERPE